MKNQLGGIHCPEAVAFVEREIRPPPDIIRILKNKIKIDPPGLSAFYTEPNNRSAAQNMRFVEQKIKDYLEKGVVEQCETPPRFVNPLSVVSKVIYKTGKIKQRLVIDVSRQLNIKVEKMKSKPDELSNAEQMFEQGMWAVTLDLKAMFHHALLQDETSELFGFRIRNPKGGSTFYRYKALPFGFRNSGAVMQRLTNPLIRYLRALGIYLNLYIDDFLLLDKSKENLVKKVKLGKTVFRLAGWTFENEKSMTEPAQMIEYLGHRIDFRDMSYSIAPEKRKFIKDLVTEIVHRNQVEGQVPARNLAACLGKLAAIRKAVGPILSICLRHTQHKLGVAVFTGDIENPDWNRNVVLDNDCIKELMLASRVLSTVLSRRIPHPEKGTFFR